MQSDEEPKTTIYPLFKGGALNFLPTLPRGLGSYLVETTGQGNPRQMPVRCHLPPGTKREQVNAIDANEKDGNSELRVTNVVVGNDSCLAVSQTLLYVSWVQDWLYQRR